MRKVLVIAGPTASGKTAFSLKMAHLLNGEIISGDSVQVYRGLDIGSGKITASEMEGIPHHIIDILGFEDQYSAADFQKAARHEIDTCSGFPIICGGTDLYLKACLYDYSFSEETEQEPADPTLEALDNDTLYAMLKEADPIQSEKIHPHNRRRLLRSLTIYRRTGRPQSSIEQSQSHEMIYDTFIAGCTMDRDQLYARIDRRVEGMIHDGLLNEVENLLKQGVSFESPCMHGIGYQEWKPYAEGNATVEEVTAEIQKHSRQYAKKQYTWLNHQMPVHWFNSTDEEDTKRMIQEIMTWAK